MEPPDMEADLFNWYGGVLGALGAWWQAGPL